MLSKTNFTRTSIEQEELLQSIVSAEINDAV
jgi:hypothetical protein